MVEKQLKSRSGKFSRDKGKRGERMLAKELCKYGYQCERGQQYCGKNGNADVIGLHGIHMECKFVEKLDIRKAIKQSKSDAREGELPVVMFKKSRQPWKVAATLGRFPDPHSTVKQSRAAQDEGWGIYLLSDWIKLYKEWEADKSGRMDKVT